jgi:16S rRNA (adenine1518-N6/adenine1519-N6)-dimethyltransferase
LAETLPVDTLTTPSRIYDELQGLGGGPIASLGQNFLFDRPMLEAMVRDLGLDESDCVLEIGPGLGHLTRSLLERGCRVLAVEKDARLADTLAARLGNPRNLEVVHRDILHVGTEEIGEWAGDASPIIAGNLPYYCSSPILVRLFEEWQKVWSRAGFLLQEELVDRIVSPPGKKTYGRLSVLCQAFSTPTKTRTVPPHLFVPRPEVNSAWCVLFPRQQTAQTTPTQLSEVTAWCFGQRRKTLSNNLAHRLGKDEAHALLDRAGIDGKRRAETLSVEEFLHLVRLVFESDL